MAEYHRHIANSYGNSDSDENNVPLHQYPNRNGTRPNKNGYKHIMKDMTPIFNKYKPKTYEENQYFYPIINSKRKQNDELFTLYNNYL